MKGAIAWMANNPVAANLLMFVTIVAGLATLPRLPQELIPEIELDMITVSVVYPGASPQEVEASITARVEDQLDGLPGLKKMHSTSAEGVSTVTIELLAGEDARRRLEDVQSEIDAITTFPEEAEEPQVKQLEVSFQVLNIAVSGDADEWTLKRVGQQVRDELTALPQITDARLTLARPYEVSIEVSEASLRRFGLSFDQVVQAVRQSSLDLPGGAVKTDAGEILLRAKGQAYDRVDFERIALVSGADGTRLSLGDVAEVRDGFAEGDQQAKFDGTPAVLVKVFRVGDQKNLEIAEAVRGYVAEAQGRMPEGIKLTIWKDESQVLADRLSTMNRNAAGGFLLVVLILACFLRLRLALWVSLGIPISFLGAVALLPLMDVTINFVSLLAFIVVLGIVVDDAIVVGENVHTEQEKTGDKLEGAVRGTESIVVPVTFGVLTTVAAFLPLAFLPGPMGRMTLPLPLVVIACLLFSLVECMLILPAHLAHGRKELDAEPRYAISRGWRSFQEKVASGLSYLIHQRYRPLLERALEWRYLTVAIALACLIVTGGLVAGGHLKFVFMEDIEADLIVVDLTMTPGTPAYITADAIAHIEEAAEAVRAEIDAETGGEGSSVIQHVMASVGEQPHAARQRNMLVSGVSRGHIGEVQAQLADAKSRTLPVSEIRRRWREKLGDIPGAAEVKFSSALGQSSAPIELRLSGNDMRYLEAAAEAVKHELARYPGVYDIADDFSGGKQELEVDILPAAESLGLTLADLARQLRQGFYGEEAQSIQRGRDEVKVMVRYPADERSSLGDVESMRIRGQDGTQVPFSSVARARLSQGYAEIRHANRRRVITVSADVDQAVANANEIVADLQQRRLAEALAPYRGVQYSFEGQQAEQTEFLSGMGIGFGFALLMIYTLLAVPLRSYLQPFIIMTAIPFGMVGAAIGHMLLGHPLTMYSIIGLIALAGVVVNDSLVLVDQVNKKAAELDDLHEAVSEAAVSRFRPILLTSLTTFGGLTPMLLETSIQAQFMIPMAISIAYGVVFATFVSLFLVPCAYLVLDDFFGLISRGLSEPADRRARLVSISRDTPEAAGENLAS